MSETLTICHDWHDGTTLHGTTKNSPAHRIAKDARSWLWRGGQKVWGVRSSKQRAPKHPVIRAMVTELTEAGYTVDTDIDDTVPGITEREQVEAERWENIADRHDHAAGTLHAAGQAKIDKADQFYQHLPFGQPILVGHHSEKADRNRRERESNRLHSGFEQQRAAQTRTERAREAAAHMGARYSPKTVGNRIEKLAAEERALLLKLDGGKPQWHHPHDGTAPWFGKDTPPVGDVRERIDTDLARVREDLDYWRTVRAEHIADGRTVDPTTVEKGDWVKALHTWVPVRRVNKKTVSVPHPMFEWRAESTTRADGQKEWQETVPFHKLAGHRKADNPPPGSTRS